MTFPILVNGRFLGRPVTGVERYARQVLAAAAEIQPGRFELVAPPSSRNAEPIRAIPVRIAGRLEGHAWEQFELPRFTRGRPLLNLCNLAPLAHLRQVTVMHDAAPFAVPESFSLAFRTYYRTMLPLVARRSRRVVTVSEFSRRELARHLHLPEDLFEVVPAAVDQLREVEADPRILQRIGATSRPFVLTVGSLDPRKNLAAVLEAAHLLPDLHFVVAGGGNRDVFRSVGLELPPNAEFVGYVTDPELKALYEHAAVFAFPSYYEGFGLPPLEAMSCGCPVVTSRAASLPEICGDAAMYCDPADSKELAAALRRLANDSVVREAARRAGCDRTRAFSWRRSAARLLAVLDEGLVA